MAYPPLIPYLVVSDAAAAIDFYKSAFDAIELTRHTAGPMQQISHAHLLINGGSIMLSDDFSGMMGGKSMIPEALGGSPITLHLVLEDVDAFWERAVAAGAQVKMELADQFWGDRYGQLVDPYGHIWSLGQTKAQLSDEQIKIASDAYFEGRL
jgi:PhnB protein